MKNIEYKFIEGEETDFLGYLEKYVNDNWKPIWSTFVLTVKEEIKKDFDFDYYNWMYIMLEKVEHKQ